jgi:hypothetical protein
MKKIIEDFYLELFGKCCYENVTDKIMRPVTLTSDYIKWFSLYFTYDLYLIQLAQSLNIRKTFAKIFVGQILTLLSEAKKRFS